MIAGQIEIQMSADIARLRSGIDTVKTELGDLAGTAKTVTGTLGMLGGALVLKEAIQSVVALGRELINAQIRAEALRTSLDFSSGGRSAQEIEYLRRVTNGLGLELQTTANSYAKLQASARGTSLEGEGARRTFEAVAKASAVMGLSAQQNEGVLLALTQMISKGTVQSEELRGQLGERLPGAFQIAARAMGVTTAELGKMLEEGLVPASTFLPKFAAQLEKELGDSATNAANRTEGAINRLANAWEHLKQATASGAVGDTTKSVAGDAASAIDYIAQAMDRAKASGGGFAATLGAAYGAATDLYKGIAGVDYNLQQAEKDLARLMAQFNESPNLPNPWLGPELASAKALVEELRKAKVARDALNDGSSQDSQFASASQAIATIATQNVAAQKALTEARNKALGVNDSYIKQVMELYKWQQLGYISEREYTETVKALTAETYHKTAADNGAIEAGKKLISDAAERLQNLRAEADGTKHLTEGQKFAMDAMIALRDGKVKLGDAGKRLLVQFIEETRALEIQRDAYKSTLKEAQALADQRNKEQEGITSYLALEGRRQEQAIDGSRSAYEAAKAEFDNYGLLRSQIAQVTLLRLIDQQAATRSGTDAYRALQMQIDSQQKLVEILRKGEVREANVQAAKDYADAWRDTASSIENMLMDAIQRGGESGWKTLQRMVAQNALRAVVQLVAGGTASVLLGGSGSGGGAAGTLGATGSLINAGAGAYSLFGGMSQAQIGAQLGQLYGTSNIGYMGGAELADAGFGASAAIDAGAIGAGAEGAGAAAGAATAGEAAGAMSGMAELAAAAPYIAAIVAVLYAAFGDHSKWSLGSVGTGSFDSSGTFGRTNMDAPFEFGNNTEHDRPDSLGKLVDAIGVTISQAATQYGGQALAGLSLSANTDIDRDGKAAGQLALIRDGQRIGGVQTGTGAFAGNDPGAAGKIDAKDLTTFFTSSVPQIMVEALQQSDLADRFETYFNSVAASDLTADKAAQMLQTAQAVTKLTDAFEPLGSTFTQFGTISIEAFTKIATAAGGFDQLATSVSSYYDAYYTTAEKTQISTEGMRKAFSDVGLVLPDVSQGADAVHQQIRSLVNGLDLSTESGQKAFQTIMSYAGAIDSLAQASDAAAKQAQQEADQAAKEAQQRQAEIDSKHSDLDIELLRAQGDELGAVNLERQRELEALQALDPSLVSLQQSIYDTADAAAAAAKRTADAQATYQKYASDRQALAGIDPKYVAQAKAQLAGGVGAYGGPDPLGLHNASVADFAKALADADAKRQAGNEATRQSMAGNSSDGSTIEEAYRQRAAEQAAAEQAQLAATKQLISTLDTLEASLSNFAHDLLFGDLSTLSPEQQYEQSKAGFEAVARQAQAGDTAAIQAFEQASRTFLQISREYNGGGAAFVGDQGEVVDALHDLQALVEATEANTRPLAQTTAQTAIAAGETAQNVLAGTALGTMAQLMQRSSEIA